MKKHFNASLTICVSAMALLAVLGGCSPHIVTPSPDFDETLLITGHWHAPLPHSGQTTDLKHWWGQFEDPLMLRLIDAGQSASPTIAGAASMIADARAVRSTRRASLLPVIEARAEGTRSESQVNGPIETIFSGGVQASWELDLFGANRASYTAAQAQLESQQANWHEARVSVAAEIATSYVDLRACQAKLEQAEQEARSRHETEQMTRLMADAGFRSDAEVHMAMASRAESQMQLIEQRADCEIYLKSLMALTALNEEELRQDLASSFAKVPLPAELNVARVPAQVIAQRPDIYAAARELMVASAEHVRARALRWPQITLNGYIGSSHIESNGLSTDSNVWNVGPVSVTLPLFDGGVRRANIEAAREHYKAATVLYAARLRNAVKEVETALVNLHSVATRSDEASVATEGYERSYQATQASYQAGTASVFELEIIHRSLVAAKIAEIELQRERVVTWITLYRAMGGGWNVAKLEAEPEV